MMPMRRWKRVERRGARAEAQTPISQARKLRPLLKADHRRASMVRYKRLLIRISCQRPSRHAARRATPPAEEAAAEVRAKVVLRDSTRRRGRRPLHACTRARDPGAHTVATLGSHGFPERKQGRPLLASKRVCCARTLLAEAAAAGRDQGAVHLPDDGAEDGLDASRLIYKRKVLRAVSMAAGPTIAHWRCW